MVIGRVYLFSLILFLIFTSKVQGELINYFYDDAGRLVRVLRDTEGVIYQYDEVGNLLFITKSDVRKNPPILDAIIPEILFKGRTLYAILKGQNLFTTQDLITDNPFLKIKVLNITDTEIRAEIAVLSDAPSGIANITVITLFGSATISVDISDSRVILIPDRFILYPGSIGIVETVLSPSTGRSLQLSIKNSDPHIITVPEIITIPSSGKTSFSISALNEGMATLNVGGSKAVVGVMNPFQMGPDEQLTEIADAISVLVVPSSEDMISSPSLSVMMEAPQDAFITSLPLSIFVVREEISGVTALSMPLSVLIEPQLTETIVSRPVSAYVESLEDTRVVSLPVSIYLEYTTVNSLISSLPVSVKITSQ